VTGPLTVNDDVTIGGNGFLTVASGGLVEFSSAVNVFNDVTVTGHVYISATPTNPNDATRKDYVDAQVATRLTQTAADARYLQLTGGTLTGTLTATSIGASGTVSGNFVQSTLDLIAGRDVQGRDLIASRDVISTGHVYVGVAPTNANDAARKDYVDAQDATKAPLNLAINALGNTSGYTFGLSDNGKLVTDTAAVAVTMTVPPNSGVPLPVGAQIHVAQLGTGKITVAPGSGVTVSATPSLGFRAQYSMATLIKVATDTWLLVGDLA
jgi:hypothetical protein